MILFTKKQHAAVKTQLLSRPLLCGFLLVCGLSACGQPKELISSNSPATVVPSEVSDLDITAKVINALSRDDVLMLFDIQVVTTKGDVMLSGAVDTQAQIDHALTLTRNVVGVTSVHDKLTLKP